MTWRISYCSYCDENLAHDCPNRTRTPGEFRCHSNQDVHNRHFDVDSILSPFFWSWFEVRIGSLRETGTFLQTPEEQEQYQQETFIFQNSEQIELQIIQPTHSSQEENQVTTSRVESTLIAWTRIFTCCLW